MVNCEREMCGQGDEYLMQRGEKNGVICGVFGRKKLTLQ